MSATAEQEAASVTVFDSYNFSGLGIVKSPSRSSSIGRRGPQEPHRRQGNPPLRRPSQSQRGALSGVRQRKPSRESLSLAGPDNPKSYRNRSWQAPILSLMRFKTNVDRKKISDVSKKNLCVMSDFVKIKLEPPFRFPVNTATIDLHERFLYLLPKLVGPQGYRAQFEPENATKSSGSLLAMSSMSPTTSTIIQDCALAQMEFLEEETLYLVFLGDLHTKLIQMSQSEANAAEADQLRTIADALFSIMRLSDPERTNPESGNENKKDTPPFKIFGFSDIAENPIDTNGNLIFQEVIAAYKTYAKEYSAFAKTVASVRADVSRVTPNFVGLERELMEPFSWFIEYRFYLWRTTRSPSLAEALGEKHKLSYQRAVKKLPLFSDALREIYASFGIEDNFDETIKWESELNLSNVESIDQTPKVHISTFLAKPYPTTTSPLPTSPRIITSLSFAENPDPSSMNGEKNQKVQPVASKKNRIRMVEIVLFTDTLLIVEKEGRQLRYPPMPLSHVRVADRTCTRSYMVLEVKLSPYKLIFFHRESGRENIKFVQTFEELKDAMVKSASANASGIISDEMPGKTYSSTLIFTVPKGESDHIGPSRGDHAAVNKDTDAQVRTEDIGREQILIYHNGTTPAVYGAELEHNKDPLAPSFGVPSALTFCLLAIRCTACSETTKQQDAPGPRTSSNELNDTSGRPPLPIPLQKSPSAQSDSRNGLSLAREWTRHPSSSLRVHASGIRSWITVAPGSTGRAIFQGLLTPTTVCELERRTVGLRIAGNGGEICRWAFILQNEEEARAVADVVAGEIARAVQWAARRCYDAILVAPGSRLEGPGAVPALFDVRDMGMHANCFVRLNGLGEDGVGTGKPRWEPIGPVEISILITGTSVDTAHASLSIISAHRRDIFILRTDISGEGNFSCSDEEVYISLGVVKYGRSFEYMIMSDEDKRVRLFGAIMGEVDAAKQRALKAERIRREALEAERAALKEAARVEAEAAGDSRHERTDQDGAAQDPPLLDDEIDKTSQPSMIIVGSNDISSEGSSPVPNQIPEAERIVNTAIDLEGAGDFERSLDEPKESEAVGLLDINRGADEEERESSELLAINHGADEEEFQTSELLAIYHRADEQESQTSELLAINAVVDENKSPPSTPTSLQHSSRPPSIIVTPSQTRITDSKATTAAQPGNVPSSSSSSSANLNKNARIAPAAEQVPPPSVTSDVATVASGSETRISSSSSSSSFEPHHPAAMKLKQDLEDAQRERDGLLRENAAYLAEISGLFLKWAEMHERGGTARVGGCVGARGDL
ncbi:hypothetical protein BDK51DRAFT_28337 [Blyttiomyces helicus]|uniref:Uncharacterized protein n=1 Tax=Blyttiomyces helicus TaxID=388810 RepID=A0A4P9WRA6_9FUNG|nr:hypothetical protein BDK51DRAFT_28337 [Blyttiomyces helicus]|eukprot:RKO94378.1 hypothetical protein BDK51DRAFT_28337 [Blyttiomyces helicus]